MKHRAFCVTSPGAPLAISPFSKSKAIPKVNFIFTGQGAQWAGMGKELMENFIGFHQDIRDMDDVLAQLPDPPKWTIEGAHFYPSVLLF
jgi:acyl transferase domain-containing protein